MTNPTQFTWTPPTTNTDGTPIDPSEITGYEIGIRLAGTDAGAYTITVPVSGEATSVENFSDIAPLAPGDYFAAMRTVGPIDSAYTPEVAFTIAAPPAPVPNPPSNFSVG